jgi:undecaprenyl-diphosphatase
VAHSGDSWFWGIGLGLLWYFGNDFWKAQSIILLIAIGIMALIVLLLKFTVRRQRPLGNWGDIYRRTDPHSFPSGHAARAILLATLVTGVGPFWLGAILMLWAPLVALARVALGVHYLSDVFVGAVLGFLGGLVGLHMLP